MAELDFTPGELQKALKAAQYRKDYNRKRYYEKHYGAAPPTTVQLPTCTFKGVVFKYAKILATSNHIAFIQGNIRVDGPEGWYVAVGAGYRHVSFAEDLLGYADEVQDPLWELIRPDLRATNHYRTVAEAARERLVALLQAYVLKNYFADFLEHQTIGELCAKAPPDIGFGTANDALHMSLRLYFESVDVLKTVYYDGFERTLGEVVATGRAYAADLVRRQDEIHARALLFRDMAAKEFGFKLTPRGHYARKTVEVFNDGSVHIDGNYVCLVPMRGGHQAAFPTGDVVAAKMITLATGARNEVSTLRSYISRLEAIFEEKK